MNKTIFIIAIVFASLLGGSYLLINSNPQLKSMAEKYKIIDAPAPIPIPASYNAVFCIFDPSGSGKSDFSTPTISVNFINQLIFLISEKGYGEIWLTYIDRSALNNKVLHFSIPEEVKSHETPIRKSGELKGEFDKRLAAFRNDSIRFNEQYQAVAKNYSKSKSSFLSECSKMILEGYAPKKNNEDYSDIIGSLNASIRSLSTVQYDSTHFRSIALISDGVQDIPIGDQMQQLKVLPEDVILVSINHSGSFNSVVPANAIEVDNLDRCLEKVIRIYKPKIQ